MSSQVCIFTFALLYARPFPIIKPPETPKTAISQAKETKKNPISRKSPFSSFAKQNTCTPAALFEEVEDEPPLSTTFEDAER